MIAIPLRTGLGLNSREHWRVRTKRVKAERQTVGFALLTAPRFRMPCTVVLTRVAPSNGLDDDNLAGALKAVRDAVAERIGIDDRDPRVKWRYEQRRGPWGVEIDSRTPLEELTQLSQELGMEL